MLSYLVLVPGGAAYLSLGQGTTEVALGIKGVLTQGKGPRDREGQDPAICPLAPQNPVQPTLHTADHPSPEPRRLAEWPSLASWPQGQLPSPQQPAPRSHRLAGFQKSTRAGKGQRGRPRCPSCQQSGRAHPLWAFKHPCWVGALS